MDILSFFTSPHFHLIISRSMGLFFQSSCYRHFSVRSERNHRPGLIQKIRSLLTRKSGRSLKFNFVILCCFYLHIFPFFLYLHKLASERSVIVFYHSSHPYIFYFKDWGELWPFQTSFGCSFWSHWIACGV